MIEVNTRIHDRYSVEFKMGFVADSQPEESNFKVGMWIFVPSSLDITPASFTHAEFSRSVKSNIRLITPQFRLCDIVGGDAVPLNNVVLASDADHEYQMKLFCAIVKSSMRAQRMQVLEASGNERKALCEAFVADVRAILAAVDGMRTSEIGLRHKECHEYCGEFLLNAVAQNCVAIYAEGKDPYVAGLLREVDGRREACGYPKISADDDNAAFLHRRGVLKKYVESLLYLRVPKKRDGVVVEQAYYSLAAGLAMIFATLVAWAFQRHFGNLTWPLFIALIISYMLKDRIKELMRFWFAHRLGDRYYDNKAKISIHDTEIGELKEAVDFIPKNKIPAEVDALRGSSHLFSAENHFTDENVLLYRKKVKLDRARMEAVSTYRFSGVNDIIRLQVRPFLRKMDDPEQTFYLLDGQDKLQAVPCSKEYHVNIVLQYRYGDVTEYKRFRLKLDRDGIKGLEEI